MKQIRRGVFETNSSSTHSLTICTKGDYEKWERGEVFLNENGGYCSNSPYRENKFVTKEEAIDILINSKYPPDDNLMDYSEADFFTYFAEEGFHTCEQYWDDQYLEGYDESFTTPSGDEVICFGKYGYDG